MIQTEIRNSRNELEKLEPHDPRYWEGPYRYEPYPKLLFKATTGGKYQEPETCVVQNQHEHTRLGSDWAETPDEARAICDRYESLMAKEAAARLTRDQHMSANARAEALAADRATDEMVPSIPEQKRRGRPTKASEARS